MEQELNGRLGRLEDKVDKIVDVLGDQRESIARLSGQVDTHHATVMGMIENATTDRQRLERRIDTHSDKLDRIRDDVDALRNGWTNDRARLTGFIIGVGALAGGGINVLARIFA